MPSVLPFQITITIDLKRYRLGVAQIDQGKNVERYELTAGDKRLVMETNRPVIDRQGLKRFPYTWRLVEGHIPHRSIQQDIIKELERHPRGQVKPDENRGMPSGIMTEQQREQSSSNK